MKKGLLLINLGTPDAPSTSAVRRYLKEFLSDPRVIDVPALARWLLTRLVILPFRPRQSAKAYQLVWDKQGSPLRYHGSALANALNEHLGDHYTVVLGMRYGKPSIQQALKELQQACCTDITVLPLFPQYASASSGSAIAKTLTEVSTLWNVPSIRVLPPFYDHPGFIKAYATQIERAYQATQPDAVVFSYHGLPERHLEKSGCAAAVCKRPAPCGTPLAQPNCYRGQCYQSSYALMAALNLDKDRCFTAFQSRLGKTPWIQPYTDELLPTLIKKGLRRLLVVCPSFVADCLETLEEIAIRGQEQWQELGGERLDLVPCLNDSPEWVAAISAMVLGSKRDN